MSADSELLQDADKFYFVARALRAEAQRLNEQSEYLEKAADRMCEENIKRTPMPQGPSPPFAPVPMLQGCMICGGHHMENMPCPQLAPTCSASHAVGDDS